MQKLIIWNHMAKILKILGILTVFIFCVLVPFSRPKATPEPLIKLGIDVLEESGFDILQGKKIGILTNQAGVNGKGIQTWKVLKNAPGVDLKVIFAPVHGLNGKYMSDETFYNDEVDGIPVYSVYASNSKPKDEWLRGLDAVVVDLQGLGIRYYNYWAFMIYMMVACFEKDIEVIVLDRPNPLGGRYTGGPIMEAEHTSIWGPIVGLPLFHGMTIGELALFAKDNENDIHAHQQIETGVLHAGLGCPKEIFSQGKLVVVPMKNWKRDMLWQDTGLRWVQTSPYIPNLQSAYEFALINLATLVSSNHRSSNCNFFACETDWENNLPFHRFFSRIVVPSHIIRYVYETCGGHPEGYTLTLSKKNKNAVEINIKDFRKTIPGFFALTLIALSQKHSRFDFNSEENYNFLGALIGDSELLEKLFRMEHINPRYFEDKWHTSALHFIEKSKRFYRYD
ncbi:MAG: DUF1343 domain-containing protein [Puniceicoccales bacterium]|nr:DUF1343 domain-containing protein [Puniceicoccales bacterium]